MLGFSTHATSEDRKLATQRALLEGANYIVEYRDVDPHPFGLDIATVNWVPDGKVWIDSEQPNVHRFVNRSALAFEGSS